MRMTLAWGALAACTLLAQQRSFVTDSTKLNWQNVELPGLPKGMLQRALHDNKQTKAMSGIFRFPKGYRDPRHYHTTCSHSFYILKGRLQTPDGVLTTGAFVYSAPTERHGPLIALEETDMLLYTDGPIDYIVDDVKR